MAPQDLLLDLEEVDRQIETMPMRGVKGTTGTQASFLDLFDGDHDKVKALDKRIGEFGQARVRVCAVLLPFDINTFQPHPIPSPNSRADGLQEVDSRERTNVHA